MSYKVKLLSEASLDIKEIIEWYNEEKQGLGRRFYKSLKSRLNYISNYPFHCQVAYRDIRNILVDKFPYQIHFRIKESEKSIIVIAITHTSRNPRVWKRKR
ncbi:MULTISPECIES: type II toxin-antitoxin system RelE/ParE family toxin [Cyclobacterium]|uniref:Plasmid stabilization system n=2 Tax=Cyclobacterium TaxID=68288 RepID=G0IYC6_CYCMS|nr:MULTISPECIES: type II toxin-antitoxin system RelE/ParE family toxin [Cyclobacterium]AEL25661.1 plasmid stabilization system [Cyclobacterium marinum DSM 745]AKP51252.1 Plasmid stabilization system [Cyclobacterium amurskyense]MBI0401091.1 type II toxin-antitoxin system RelE/ParE family toxin [Cyclobacterium marinum]MBR9775451.1 type II toxin-antitoxin system RelE/ParE family toxin [Cytophagales bacterium]|tara:strand:+ start:7459 stop:7761 length:303 start_codon:yes stop_codon:yes gene_type:complete